MDGPESPPANYFHHPFLFAILCVKAGPIPERLCIISFDSGSTRSPNISSVTNVGSIPNTSYHGDGLAGPGSPRACHSNPFLMSQLWLNMVVPRKGVNGVCG